MAYCTRCRLGAVDDGGLCVLCGASQTPPTGRGRLAEAGGAVLATLLNPALVGVALLAFLVFAVAAVTQFGQQVPAGAPRVGFPSPASVVAAAEADPGGTLLRLLLPAIVQALIFGLVLLALVLAWRRGAGRSRSDREDVRSQPPAWRKRPESY